MIVTGENLHYKEGSPNLIVFAHYVGQFSNALPTFEGIVSAVHGPGKPGQWHPNPLARQIGCLGPVLSGPCFLALDSRRFALSEAIRCGRKDAVRFAHDILRTLTDFTVYDTVSGTPLRHYRPKPGEHRRALRAHQPVVPIRIVPGANLQQRPRI